MASADCCSPIRHLSTSPAIKADSQLSQGKARDLRSIYLPHIRRTSPDSHWIRVYMPSRPPVRRLSMRFVFLRPELCLQLPSHPASRRRSCCSARSSRLSGPPEDFHLQVTSQLAFARWLLAEILTPKRSMQASTRSRPVITGAALVRHAWRT